VNSAGSSNTPSVNEPVLVGVDIGTSGVKILACTFRGATVARAAASYPVSTPQPERVEQDPNVVYEATMGALGDVLRGVRAAASEVAAIGLSCALHGLLAVDAAGEPLGPSITWLDRRSAAIAERWRADGTADELYAKTGAPVHPMLPACKLRWLAEHDASVIEQAARFVSLKELLIFRWTGEWLIDWGMASGTGLFDFRARAWSDAALRAAGIAASKLCELAPPSTTLRALRPAVASALDLDVSTPVVLASSDGALANLGVGAVAAGDVALTLGTSGAVRLTFERPSLDPHGRTFCYAYDDRKYVVGGPTSSGGAVLARLFDLFMPEVPAGDRLARALALAEAASPGAAGVTVMPFLAGERAPYWIADLRGGIAGLDLTQTAGDVLRAAFESVVFALASVLEVVRERSEPVARIRLSGGLMHAAFLRQMVADVFACEAVLPDHDEASAFGAAAAAGIAVGALADDRAVAALLRPRYVHEPRSENIERYAEAFARYRRVVEANLPLYLDRNTKQV
jgi:gluconokinase